MTDVLDDFIDASISSPSPFHSVFRSISLGSNIGLVYSLKVTHQKGYPSLRLEKENVKDTQEEIYKKTSITIWRMN